MSSENGQALLGFVDPPTTDGSDSDSWCTPEEVLRCVYETMGDIDLDPCSNPHSQVAATTEWTITDDAFSKDWSGYKRIYCNPPYSNPGRWLQRCRDAHALGAEVIVLVKCDPSVRWWNRHMWTATAIAFWSKRIAFVSQGTTVAGNNFASALGYWGPRFRNFHDAFSPHATIIRPR